MNEKFINQVKKIVEEKFPHYTVEMTHVTKNNNQSYECMILRTNGSQLAPTIYLEKLYDECVDNEENSEAIISKYLDNIAVSIKSAPFDIVESLEKNDPEMFNIHFKLINRYMNETKLRNIPHRAFGEDGDIVVTYQCLFDSMKHSFSNIEITNALVERWGIDEEKLFEYAMKNLDKSVGRIFTMEEVIAEMLGIEEEIVPKQLDMFVASTKNKIYGAAALLKRDLFKDEQLFSEYEHVYIIPSSVHEVLLVPGKEDVNPNHLKETIREVNNTEVANEDILSFELYVWERKTNGIRVWTGSDN